MTAASAAGLYIGLNLLILFGLGVLTSLARQKTQIGLGDGGNEDMIRAIRAHGNATEWVPGALVGLLALALMGAPAIAIHVLGIMLTLARILHGYGLTTSAGPSLGRLAGSSLTLLVYLGLALGLIGHAIL